MILEQILNNNGVFEFPGLKVSADQIELFASAHGYRFYLIDHEIKNKAELLEAIANACEFPDYFGYNWDALFDCLRDFSFAPAKGYIFGIFNAAVLKQILAGDYEPFIEIFSDASRSWVGEGVKFILLLG